MKILAIETSTKKFSLAIADGKAVLRFRNFSEERVLSSALLPALQALLKLVGLTFADIEGIAVGLGPGSFTSLRVGLSTVKALAFTAHLPVVGVCSLDLIALNAPPNGRVRVLCDAKRDLVYTAVYEKKDATLRRISDNQLLPIAAAESLSSQDQILIGDGLALLAARGRKTGQKNQPLWITNKKLWLPQAKNIFALVFDRFAAKQVADSSLLVPLYLYPEDCQIKKG
ncbi:MAG: tRNA (adenosine(37)-N6)-threonylcarbamoyltransferase complex dimerization subunit type 1 TsaB [Candidatus Omnitrophica bacterium]|nr:tRNA (adenosine(37)-N6)-threonylcarbamoyltransferase complex dimerization subunit type 1 TsaB [Candidatus Omnitrophota bacterium]